MTPAQAHDTLLRVTGNGDVVAVRESSGTDCGFCGAPVARRPGTTEYYHLPPFGDHEEPIVVQDWHNRPRYD